MKVILFTCMLVHPILKELNLVGKIEFYDQSDMDVLGLFWKLQNVYGIERSWKSNVKTQYKIKVLQTVHFRFVWVIAAPLAYCEKVCSHIKLLKHFSRLIFLEVTLQESVFVVFDLSLLEKFAIVQQMFRHTINCYTILVNNFSLTLYCGQWKCFQWLFLKSRLKCKKAFSENYF